MQGTETSVLSILFRYRWWCLVPAILISIATTAWVVHLKDQYESNVLILIHPLSFPEDYLRRSNIGGLENQVQTLREVLLSRTLLEKVIDEFGLYRKDPPKMTRDERLEQMRKDIRIQVKWNDVFSFSYKTDLPATARDVSNRLAEQFVTLVQSHVEQVQATNSRMELLKTRIQELKFRLDDLVMTYTEGYPEVPMVKRQILEAQQRLEKERMAQEALESLERDPNTAVRAAGTSARAVPLRKVAEILDLAVTPSKPSGPPRVPIAILGVLLGCGVGVGIGLIRGRMDVSFSELEDVRIQTGLPVLAIVPRIARSHKVAWRVAIAFGIVGIVAAATIAVLYRFNHPTRELISQLMISLR